MLRVAAGEDLGFGETDPNSPGELAVMMQHGIMMQLLPGEIQVIMGDEAKPGGCWGAALLHCLCSHGIADCMSPGWASQEAADAASWHPVYSPDVQHSHCGCPQDPTRLEMGRKYEEVDSGEVNRESGAPATEREKIVASGALRPGQ